MRKLTITRRRTFVGCAGKLKVYVVDNLHNDLDVCGESCRLIGTLKNGRIEPHHQLYSAYGANFKKKLDTFNYSLYFNFCLDFINKKSRMLNN